MPYPRLIYSTYLRPWNMDKALAPVDPYSENTHANAPLRQRPVVHAKRYGCEEDKDSRRYY